MSIAAAQWAVCGYPAPLTLERKRSQPFGSSLGRVRRIVERVPAYRGFEAEEISWERFRDYWLPRLERDGLLVGVNWSGSSATGYDVTPSEVRDRIEHELGKVSPGNG